MILFGQHMVSFGLDIVEFCSFGLEIVEFGLAWLGLEMVEFGQDIFVFALNIVKFGF